MSIKGKAYIAGIYEHPTRLAKDISLAQIHAEVRQGRARGCRPHQGRRRRLFLRRRRARPRADVDGRLHGAEAAPRRFHRHRRLVLRAPCRPRRRGDRGRQVQGGADHAGRPAARRGHGDRHRAAHARRHADAGRAVRVPLRADRREHVRHVRHAPHARVRHDQRAARLDQGRRLAPRAVQPARAAAATWSRSRRW